MKSIVSIIAVALIIFACGEKKTEKADKEDFGTPEETKTEAPAAGGDAVAQGEALVNQNDCKTCHSKDKKIIGPSHMDVAKKYDFTEANVKMLAQKIITGGSGVWGEIAMTAHDIPQADAEKMARYVLSLDGEKEH